MNFVAVIFLACIAIHSGFSSDPALNSSSLSGNIPASVELETCPTNLSVSFKVFRNLQGEWLTTYVARNELLNLSRYLDLNTQKEVLECNGSKYISISGFLMGKDADNSSQVFVGEHRNISGGEDSNSCKGSPTKLDMIFLNQTLGENLNVSIKSSDRMEKMENRLDSLENTLQSFNKTMDEIKNMLKDIQIYGSGMHFDFSMKGKNIELHNNLKTAIRGRGIFHAGVLSNLPLIDDVAYEIRIDETVDAFKDYGIALGVIVKKEEGVKEKTSLCYNARGTYGVVSDNYSNKGKSHIYKDGKRIRENAYDMDTRNLPVGTTLGIVRRSNGALHFLMNGKNRGVAFESIPVGTYAFVDVMYNVSKISIKS